jgi:hypothetical protein
MLIFKRLDPRIVIGILLIVGGILFLLQNLNLLPGGDVFWAIAFGLGALIFLWTFISDRQQWWALIPGFALLGIAARFVVGLLVPRAEDLGGALFLGLLSLGFWAVYAVERQHWWAVIPGGVLLTLAVVAGMDNLFKETPWVDTGAIFFLGLGLTFMLVGILPTPQGRMRWAFIPGGILLIMGLLIALSSANLINVIAPLALIVGGGVLVWRAFRPR